MLTGYIVPGIFCYLCVRISSYCFSIILYIIKKFALTATFSYVFNSYMFCRRHSGWEMIVALTWLCSNCTNSGWHCQWLRKRKLVNPFKQLKSRSSLFLKLNNDKTSNFKWLLTKLELSCVRNIIPRSKSGACKSRPRWAAHTRIGNVWEYPPPCLLVQGGEAKYFLCFSI